MLKKKKNKKNHHSSPDEGQSYGMLALAISPPRPQSRLGHGGGVGSRILPRWKENAGRAEALAFAPWLGNNIVPRIHWGQCVEVNKIFIVRANSHGHLMNNGIYRPAEAHPATRGTQAWTPSLSPQRPAPAGDKGVQDRAGGIVHERGTGWKGGL